VSFKLSEVDVDGAIEETGSHVDGHTRAAFMRKAGVAGGATLTGGAFLASLPEFAMAAPSKRQDLKILNFALTLEFLEAAFYKEAVESGALSGAALDLGKILAADERVHVTALRSTIKKLGGTPVPSPEFDFRGTTKDQQKFLETAFTLENTGVRAYLGQAGRLKSKALLGVAASIVTIEARHSGAVAVVLNQSPFTPKGKTSISPSGSFDKPLSMSAVLSALTDPDTTFIKG